MPCEKTAPDGFRVSAVMSECSAIRAALGLESAHRLQPVLICGNAQVSACAAILILDRPPILRPTRVICVGRGIAVEALQFAARMAVVLLPQSAARSSASRADDIGLTIAVGLVSSAAC